MWLLSSVHLVVGAIIVADKDDDNNNNVDGNDDADTIIIATTAAIAAANLINIYFIYILLQHTEPKVLDGCNKKKKIEVIAILRQEVDEMLYALH